MNMHFWIMVVLTGPAILVVAALYRFSGWWWKVAVAGESDFYGGKDDWIALLATPILLMWGVLTLGLANNSSADWPSALAPVYALLTFWGPGVFVAAILRFAGVGYTRVGRALGFEPPSPQARVGGAMNSPTSGGG